MYFSDISLSKRLERAEGHSCLQYAEARRSIFPDSGAEWIESAGAFAVFDGVESPCTQSFGLGLFQDLSEESLNPIEKFFQDRGAPVLHEVSPYVGVPALELLCKRNYRPIELSNVLFRPVEMPAEEIPVSINVRLIKPEEVQLWSEISARGWSSEHPEMRAFLEEFGTISAARKDSFCFLAEFEGEAGAAGTLSIHDGVALFGGASTVPELRRRGLQAALL